MTYEQFIERLKQLIAQGEALLRQHATQEMREFRDWWLEVRGDVELMGRDYELPGPFTADRMFRAGVFIPNRDLDRKAFDRDMGDALAELRRLVDQYRYGPPRRKSEPAAAPAAAAAGGHTVHIHNSTIGAVQAGNRSSAQVVMDATNLMRLTDALGRLRAEIGQGAGLPEDEREQSLSLIDDIIETAKAPKPAPRRMGGFLTALSASIQTAAAVPGAWDAVHHAAQALGLL